MSNQSDREAILREIAKKKVVFTLPGMDAIDVRRDIAYQPGLLMDIYVPATQAGARAPVVAVPMGYPDPRSAVRAYGPVTSWARLMASSGMAAVIYGATTPADDIHVVLDYVRAHADTLGVDAGRIGVLAASGNVPVALSALMRDTSLKAAALLCGFTMDVDGSTAVADAAKQFMFVDACAGKSTDELPDGVPMLFVRAGREQFPGLNEALDKVVANAVARNLPVTLVNHADGAHGFDLDDDREISREMVRRVLAFMAFHLNV